MQNCRDNKVYLLTSKGGNLASFTSYYHTNYDEAVQIFVTDDQENIFMLFLFLLHAS